MARGAWPQSLGTSFAARWPKLRPIGPTIGRIAALPRLDLDDPTSSRRTAAANWATASRWASLPIPDRPRLAVEMRRWLDAQRQARWLLVRNAYHRLRLVCS